MNAAFFMSFILYSVCLLSVNSMQMFEHWFDLLNF
jgi:hypothetical protein